MSNSIFVDATALVAAFNPNDDHYDEAKVLWQTIIEEDWPLLTTNWTLYEALTVVKTRARDVSQGAILVDKLWSVAQDKVIQVVTVSEEIEEAALRTFIQHRDKTWSVVDCVNFHAIVKEGCQQAFAYDEHFEQAAGEFGFQLLAG